jgi:hypothetical protein
MPRKLLTGMRQGSRIVIQEFEEKAFGGYFKVLVYCGKCKTAKTIRKASIQSLDDMATDCGCQKKQLKRWCRSTKRLFVGELFDPSGVKELRRIK